MTLQQDCSYDLMVALGGMAVSYERGAPVADIQFERTIGEVEAETETGREHPILVGT